MFRLRPRLRGAPASANGASSFHLWWRFARSELLEEASAVVEVVVPPSVPRLYFWALQVGFHDGERGVGAGHTGLQWLPADPPLPAVNWGGYDAGGAELGGSISSLPSLDGNPNTRLHPWRAGQPYELSVRRAASPGGPGESHAWRATLRQLGSGQQTVIRDLHSSGRFLADPVVWSEVFAHCDDPTVSVRWSDLRAVTAAGRTVVPEAVSVTYQSHSRGGCDNTTVRLDDAGIAQITNAARTVPEGTILSLTSA